MCSPRNLVQGQFFLHQELLEIPQMSMAINWAIRDKVCSY